MTHGKRSVGHVGDPNSRLKETLVCCLDTVDGLYDIETDAKSSLECLQFCALETQARVNIISHILG